MAVRAMVRLPGIRGGVCGHRASGAQPQVGVAVLPSGSWVLPQWPPVRWWTRAIPGPRAAVVPLGSGVWAYLTSPAETSPTPATGYSRRAPYATRGGCARRTRTALGARPGAGHRAGSRWFPWRSGAEPGPSGAAAAASPPRHWASPAAQEAALSLLGDPSIPVRHGGSSVLSSRAFGWSAVGTSARSFAGRTLSVAIR